MTINAAIPMFLHGHLGTDARSALTRRAYSIDLRQFQAFLGSETLVSAVGVSLLESWADHLLRERYSSASIRRKFATVRVFFQFLSRKEVIEASPLWKFRLALRKEVVLPRSLCPADARLLIERAWSQHSRERCPRGFRSIRNLAVVEVLFTTGIRVGELVKLRVADWHASECTLLIRGKGSRERLALLPDQRSHSAFTLYLSERARLPCDTELLFINHAGRGLSEQGVSLVLTRIAREAGIAPRVTPHMLRHTLATLLLRYGADLRIVQEVLGHASLTTTQRYVHVAKDHLLASLKVNHPNVRLGITAHRQPPELYSLEEAVADRAM